MRLVYRNVHIVQAYRGDQFVYFVRAQGPNVIERIGLVGTVEIFGRLGRRTVERLELEVGVIVAAELQALRVGEIDVHRQRVFARVRRMHRRHQVKLVAVDGAVQVRTRVGLQNTQAVGARLALGDDVTGN